MVAYLLQGYDQVNKIGELVDIDNHVWTLSKILETGPILSYYNYL